MYHWDFDGRVYCGVGWTKGVVKKDLLGVLLPVFVHDIDPSVNAKVGTILGSIPASSYTVESEGAADEAVLNKVE
jgi:hypothetical protein